jgi:hypothetical protein
MFAEHDNCCNQADFNNRRLKSVCRGVANVLAELKKRLFFWKTAGTSFSATQLTSIPPQLPILEHAVASAAPAASYKSP